MKKLILFLYTISVVSICFSQNINSEVALFTGMTSMQTDYGERGHFGSNYANIGFGVGGALYLSFDNQRVRWNDREKGLQEHFRIRLEISYMQTKLIHRGKYTEGTSPNTLKYNAMIGTSKILNYGAQLEYNIFSLSSKQYVDPYISIGYLINSNRPQLESSLGNIETDNSLIPPVYNNGIFLEKNSSRSLILGIGTRLRPKSYYNKSIYLIDFRWQKFNSDVVEGLKPNLSANKYKDWLLFLSVGYIFSFD